MSSTSTVSRVTLSLIMPSVFFCGSVTGPSAPIISISVKPLIGVSGVRSSWLRTARKWSLAAFADRACAREDGAGGVMTVEA